MLSTPDLCDAYEEKVRVLEPIFNNYGGVKSFFGPAVTIKCYEDNSVVKKLVSTPGDGQIIVMDGGGSLRRAILGDMLAEKAAQNGWSGLVINGCIRDVDEIGQTNLGVKAINVHPMKTDKRGIGDLNVAVQMAGQTIKPGEWIYADNNGVIVSADELS
ncbi:MAG: ribonuclease E activity regulator RraA [Gammaproteobacteria bacterium]|nr:ribonuclease E activity regulator RraA [Gammaproteobacteria bacterium]